MADFDDVNTKLLRWLDDLCVRFIINLPQEELESVERIGFHIEEAQWFYEDFIRPLDPQLPSMNLKKFCLKIFQHCPLLSNWSEQHHIQAFQEFLAYKTRVPVRGAIMLNEAMDQAVLVKGWKKGANWSFPRGKINKDEKDIDCAVREVYEETGYDIREAGLVMDEEAAKYIEVSMRDQHMRLYVFRGVPMDTHFEPRTRKEISKISWYKLSDLPTIKRNKQQHAEGTGEGLKDNKFYMVAPFLGPLKGWIKSQRRLDRQRAAMGTLPVPVSDLEETEMEEEGARLGELTADEAPISQTQPSDASFAQLVANLGRHRHSDALPEVTPQQGPVEDPAETLKRLLSVGAFPSASLPTEAPVPEQQPNPLLAMLQGSAKSTGPPLPQTPFEQQIISPPQPPTPHHHHLGHSSQLGMPPPFPFASQHLPPLHQPHDQFERPQNGFAPQLTSQLGAAPPSGPPSQPSFPPQSAGLEHATNQQTPFQRFGESQFNQPQFQAIRGTAVPSASKLPLPKLNEHSLNLLNAFRSSAKPTPVVRPPSQPPHVSHESQSSQTTPIVRQGPALQQAFNEFTSPQQLPSSGKLPHPAPTPPTFRGPSPSLETAAPKPRSAHQDTLLSLFRSPSAHPATPPPPVKQTNLSAAPVELSAHPTPGMRKVVPGHQDPAPPVPDLSSKPHLLELFQQPRKPSLTTARISGPLNAPDFETVKRQAKEMNGSSRGVSPAHSHGKKPSTPVKVLKRPQSAQRSSPRPPTPQREVSQLSPKSSVTTPQAAVFQPQILKRPQQMSPTTASSEALTTPTVNTTTGQAVALPSSFDRRDTLPTEQKNALLSLFSKPAQPVKSPKPQTPKLPVSGVISPVSPLLNAGSTQGSPANLDSRSRISSIGDGMPPSVISSNTDNIMPPVAPNVPSHGLSGEPNLPKSEKVASSTGKTPVTPVDKSFLLGFLEDVASGKRK